MGLKKVRDDQGEILRPLAAFMAVCTWTCRSLSLFHLIKMTARGWEVVSVGKVALEPASQDCSVANKSSCVNVEGQDQYLRLSSDLHIHTNTHAQRSYVEKNYKNIDNMAFSQKEF